MRRLFHLSIRMLWVLGLVTPPLLAVWLASTLVAYYGGHRNLAIVGALVVVPLLPAWWEHRATRAWKRRVASRRQFGASPKQKLTPLARLTLRTLLISTLFVGVMLGRFPKTAFAALATRGDWFLPQSAVGDALRPAVFAAASQLEWLHRWANPNPYRDEQAEQEQTKLVINPTPSHVSTEPAPDAGPPPASDAGNTSQGGWLVASDGAPDGGKPDGGADGRLFPDGGSPDDVFDPKDFMRSSRSWVVGETTWPWKPQVAAVVQGMKREQETSLEQVATLIAEQETDPFRRVKALHDWVVTRLHYDMDSVTGVRKPQDAESVFANRMGVCEGYAKLMVAMGKVTGDRILYVTGDARGERTGLKDAKPTEPHAWNAVEIKGNWYLIDATWDDPDDSYSTDYLFIPPMVLIEDHLPDEERLQLLEKPVSRGAFLRLPTLGPGWAHSGLSLRSAERFFVRGVEFMDVVIDNSSGVRVLLAVVDRSGKSSFCGQSAAVHVLQQCRVQDAREVEIFAGTGELHHLPFVRAIPVHDR